MYKKKNEKENGRENRGKGSPVVVELAHRPSLPPPCLGWGGGRGGGGEEGEKGKKGRQGGGRVPPPTHHPVSITHPILSQVVAVGEGGRGTGRGGVGKQVPVGGWAGKNQGWAGRW